MVFLTEILPESASSSSSAPHHYHTYVYDVFISFRGPDTRNGFTDYLYNALLDAGFNTFLDEEEIETGDPLKPELDNAIKSSKASIIVLSKNYASSTWCLDELVLILDQKRNFNQIVIPIFYHVEATDVMKQQDSFGEAMERHKQTMDEETNAKKRSELAQKMKSWKRALREVVDLKVKDAKGRKEREFIEEVVSDIHRRLGVLLSNTLPRLIGMDGYIKYISSWLTDGSCYTVDILTVVGIGGIGKTSLAKYIFQSHCNDFDKFDKRSFIEGINGRCNERFNGLLDLQKQLHEDMSKKLPLQVNDVSVYTSKIENVLARKRVFIVLDDIGSLDQLDALLGNKGLHPGSKIIITTKDASLTKSCALFNPQVQPRHMQVLLKGLWDSDSLELLCIHAFKSHKPKEGYKEVSENLLKYCDGHPLAIEVLGRSLQYQDVAYWEERINVLKKEPHSCIKEALHMSINSLPSQNDKELFKHIACFFVGTDRNVTETILNACGINTRSGIMILTERCLLSIGFNNELIMHQLILEMGRDLVRQESPDKPWKRSRLWCHEESFKLLKQKKGKGNILGLALDVRMLAKKKLHELETKSLRKMDNLMLLQLNYVEINGCFENFPEELRWLCMHGSPLKSLPLDLPMENLVALDMSYSNIESFNMSCSNPQPPAKRQKGLIGSSSKDKRLLVSLKILDLSSCEQLHSIGGFFELPALEKLILRNCTSLIEVCESVGQSDELVHIDMRYCCNLRKLPISIGNLKKVKTLFLDGCNSCESQIATSKMIAVPSDLKFFMISLPGSLRTLSLADNNLSNESFPRDFSCLSLLEELYLDDNPIVSMPDCLRTLPRLQRLSMDYCHSLISIENPPHTLKEISHLTNDTPGYKYEPIRKFKFDQKMSPLILEGSSEWFYVGSPIEFDGMLKVQDIASVEKQLLHSLGWIDLDLKERCWETTPNPNHTEMSYAFGIFSTFYLGKEMPDWISCRSKGSSISFTIPSSPEAKKLRGLNFCCVEIITRKGYHELPMIRISNTTKMQTWIYKFSHLGNVNLGESVIFLSHWMFGPNEMETGDHITINVAQKRFSLERYLSNSSQQHIDECGIGLVYEEDRKSAEEEDALGYYKSWNHIIGGDLSGFQLTTGEYVLDNHQLNLFSREIYSYYEPFVYHPAEFKEEKVRFKAFSKEKELV